MADAVRELIIRIRKEIAPEGEQASARAHQVERTNIAKTADEAKRAERDKTTAAKEGSRERTAAVKSEASATGLSMAAAVGSVTAAVGSMTAATVSVLRQMREAAREANSYIDGVVASSAKVSAALAQINAQTGKTPGIGATVGQAKAAAAAGVSPDTFLANQKAYQNTIGSYVGAGGKLTQQQSDRLLRMATTNAAAKGLDFGNTTPLLASLVGGGAPGASADQVMTALGATQAALRVVPGGNLNDLTRQFGELAKEQVGRGASAADVQGLAPLFAGLAAVMPNQAPNTTRTLTRGIGQMSPAARTKYGLRPGQTGIDAVRTVVASVISRMDAGQRAGQFVAGDFKDVEDSEWRSIAAGLASPTIGKAEAAMQGFTPAALAAQNAGWLNSPEGQRQAAEATTEAARRGQAARFENLNLLKERARARVVASGQLGKPEGFIGNWARTSILGWGMGGDRESDLVNAELRSGILDRLTKTDLGRAAFHELGGLGSEDAMARGDIAARLINSGQFRGQPRRDPYSPNGFSQDDPVVDKLLQVVDRMLEAATAQKEAAQAQKANIPPVPVPVPAKPPVGPARLGG